MLFLKRSQPGRAHALHSMFREPKRFLVVKDSHTLRRCCFRCQSVVAVRWLRMAAVVVVRM